MGRRRKRREPTPSTKASRVAAQVPWVVTDETLGPCGLCGRPMHAGPTVDRHHLIPKALGGREFQWMHVVCHRKIHSVLTERELAETYNSIEALRAHEQIARFVAWVRAKDPEFVTRHRWHNARRRR